MNGNLFVGFKYFAEGLKIITQPGMRLFLLIPMVVNTMLFVLLVLWAISLFDGWMTSLMSWLPSWLAFLEWFFWIIYALTMALTFFYGFVAATNFIGAPFYGYLAEITEKRLTGEDKQEPFSWKTLASMIPQTLKREIQKILYYLPRVMLFILIGLIPGINALAALLWFAFSAWMMAIQYVDYPADNNGLAFIDMKNYLRERRATSLGFGLVALGTTLVPILNLISPPAAVCGAVAFWVNEKGNEHKLAIDAQAKKLIEVDQN